MVLKISLIASSLLLLSLSALEVPTMTEEETAKQVTEQLKAEKAKEAVEVQAKTEEPVVSNVVDSQQTKAEEVVTQTTQKVDAAAANETDGIVMNSADNSINETYNEDRPYIPKKEIPSGDFEKVMPIALEIAPPEKDHDHDGVIDSKDKCPTTPLGRVVDADGCQLDDDKDGVINAVDKCPTTPLGRVVDADGCQMDEDKDGVLDYDDQCPHTPQIFKVDSQGCPLTATLKVNFDTNKYDIKDTYTQDIDTFAEFLKENPGYDAIVAGHTDSIGSETSNQTLSEHRAKSVRLALIGQGIDGARLTAVGYGEKQPIASNLTNEGRAQNRRIEVELKPKVNPTPVAPDASTPTSDTATDSLPSTDDNVDNFN